MSLYACLIYTPDQDWSDAGPEVKAQMAEYDEFGLANEAVIRGGNVLYPATTATTVRVSGGKGGDVVTTDGPYAETKEVLSGFYLVEAPDLDEAVRIAARIPATWNAGAVEVRPVIELDRAGER